MSDEERDIWLLGDRELVEIMREEAHYSEDFRHQAFLELARRSHEETRDES